MIELITKRTGHEEFNKMIAIHKCCEAHFGKTNYLVTWDVDFADDTDNYCAFKFWDESLATYLKLMYPELMSRQEFDNKSFWAYNNVLD